MWIDTCACVCLCMCVCLSQKDVLWSDQVYLQSSHWLFYPSVSSRTQSWTLAMQVLWLPVPSPVHTHTHLLWIILSAKLLFQSDEYLFFYWSIVDLQCCVSFCCTAEWLSYRYIFFFMFFCHGWLQNIEYVPCAVW